MTCGATAIFRRDGNRTIMGALPSVPNPVVKFDEAGTEAPFSIHEDNPSCTLSEHKDILLMKFDIEASESADDFSSAES